MDDDLPISVPYLFLLLVPLVLLRHKVFLRSCFGGFSRPWALLLVRRLERVSLEIFKLEDSERGRAMGVFFAVSKSNFYPWILPSYFIFKIPYFDLLDLPVWNNYRSFSWRYIFILFYFRRNSLRMPGLLFTTSTMVVVQVGFPIVVHGERRTAS